MMQLFDKKEVKFFELSLFVSFYSIKISEIKSRKKEKIVCKNFFKTFERKSRKKEGKKNLSNFL